MTKNTKVEDKKEQQNDRVRESRPKPGARAAYKSPHDINFAPELVEHFKSQGYTLRWVRCAVSGVGTNERINYYRSEGGDIVTPEEVRAVDGALLSGMTPYAYRDDMFDSGDRQQHTAIQKGDLILMKIPVEYTEARIRAQAEELDTKLNGSSERYRSETGGAVSSDIRIGGSHKGGAFNSFFRS